MKHNKLVPELSVSDFDKSIEFYLSIGFKADYRRNKFAFLSFQGSQIMIEQINDNWKVGEMHRPFGRGINLQIEVEKIGPILNALKNKNIPLFREPKDNWYVQNDKLVGNREFLVQDPDGYLLRFFEDLGSKPRPS